MDEGLAIQLHRLGLEGDYIHPAGQSGLSFPEATHRSYFTGHANDSTPDVHPGGKLPWHPAASSESPWSPDAGYWESKDGKDYYHPSPEQINAGYLSGLAEYYRRNEPNTTIVPPAPYQTIEKVK